ncbi:MAG: UMP kinase [Patescibacteria group bacterium]
MKKTAKKSKEEVVVVSVGGSMIVPEEIDTVFLSSLKDLILRGIKKGKKFIIITGGGKVCRKYQHAANSLGGSVADADWIGIDATRLNARLVKAVLGSKAEDHIIQSPLEKFVFKKSVIVAGGWKPGFSSDHDAVLLAKRFKAKKLINLSNIDYVYTADPKTNPDATKIERITWKEFRKLIPKKWTPGLSSPFDPVASKESESIGLEVAIINGKKLGELENYLEGKEFVGSLIQ